MGRDSLRAPQNRLEENQIQIHFIDVGQGDAALIHTSEGNILIDGGTGESEEHLRAYLDNLGVKTIRYAIFTHPDEDHIGGADMILRCYDVATVLLPPAEYTAKTAQTMMNAMEKEGCEILWASPNTVLQVGDVTCTILAPLRLDYEETNNLSIVLRMDYGETSVMFTGDAEEASEGDLVSRYGPEAGGLLDCDILKSGHHGSDTSSGQAFLNAVTPDFCVISCGEGNAHGHPAPSVLAAYQNMGTIVYRTDLDGSVVFTSTGGEPVKP